jgi:hypothetical protein
MGGLSNAFWLWFPVLIYKAVSAFFRTIWKLDLWILQTVSGVPLYHARPEYRIPGILLGTIGLIMLSNVSFCLMALLSSPRSNRSQVNIALSLNDLLIMGVIGLGMLLICRLLVRRGSI